jgi:transcriptional regulator with XRE-family HTH domain
MTEEIHKTFGRLVRRLRLDAGVGLRELAKMINKSPSYMSEIESGHVPPPSAAMIIDIADTLGCDRDELLAAASKVDPLLADYVAHRPEAADFLRKVREYDLDGEGWKKMEMLADIAFGSKEKKE